MEKFFIIILGICLFGFIMHFINPPQIRYAEKETSKLFETPKIEYEYDEDIKYTISKIPDNVMEYLKNRSEYKNDLDKKLIVYCAGTGCTHNRTFGNTIDYMYKHSFYENEYNYHKINMSFGFFMGKHYATKEDFEYDEYFSNKCREFCIVNPKNNQIFIFNELGEAESGVLSETLEKLKNW